MGSISTGDDSDDSQGVVVKKFTSGHVRRANTSRTQIEDHGDTQRQFFEQMGLLFEGSGMPRMAGRVIGWLLLCDPPLQTAAQVGEVVGASKGSISTVLRLLVHGGIAERVGIPGERSRFYRLREGGFAEHIRGRLTFVRASRELAERGLELMRGADEARLQRLRSFHELHALLERELPAMLARYENKARQGNRKTRGKR